MRFVESIAIFLLVTVCIACFANPSNALKIRAPVDAYQTRLSLINIHPDAARLRKDCPAFQVVPGVRSNEAFRNRLLWRRKNV